jgi:hypothetical protein
MKAGVERGLMHGLVNDGGDVLLVELRGDLPAGARIETRDVVHLFTDSAAERVVKENPVDVVDVDADGEIGGAAKMFPQVLEVLLAAFEKDRDQRQRRLGELERALLAEVIGERHVRAVEQPARFLRALGGAAMHDQVTSRFEDLERGPVLLLERGAEFVAGKGLDGFGGPLEVFAVGGGNEVMPQVATLEEDRPLGVLLDHVPLGDDLGAVPDERHFVAAHGRQRQRQPEECERRAHRLSSRPARRLARESRARGASWSV